MNTDHWNFGSGFPCPTCGDSMPSIESLGIHVSNHERDRERAAKWQDHLEELRARRCAQNTL